MATASDPLKPDPKLSIWAYEDPDFSEEVQELTQPLKVSINPETYKRTYHPLTYDDTYSIVLANGERKDGKIVDPPPEKFQLQLWFDGTGAIPGTEEVSKEIENIKKFALYYNGKIHSSNYIKVDWGGEEGLSFKGQLQSISIEYLLFDKIGKPLRAKADLSFIQFIDAQTRESLKGKNSPDLTHVRIVKAGDTLPLMCYRIYRNPTYYLKVAEANGLANFTDIQPGMKIVFPPIQK